MPKDRDERQLGKLFHNQHFSKSILLMFLAIPLALMKGGYVFGEKTFTVKLACVSFYKNVTERNLPAGSGVFVVVDAAMGCPLGIFQENRISKLKHIFEFLEDELE